MSSVSRISHKERLLPQCFSANVSLLRGPYTLIVYCIVNIQVILWVRIETKQVLYLSQDIVLTPFHLFLLLLLLPAQKFFQCTMAGLPPHNPATDPSLNGNSGFVLLQISTAVVKNPLQFGNIRFVACMFWVLGLCVFPRCKDLLISVAFIIHCRPPVFVGFTIRKVLIHRAWVSTNSRPPLVLRLWVWRRLQLQRGYWRAVISGGPPATCVIDCSIFSRPLGFIWKMTGRTCCCVMDLGYKWLSINRDQRKTSPVKL